MDRWLQSRTSIVLVVVLAYAMTLPRLVRAQETGQSWTNYKMDAATYRKLTADNLGPHCVFDPNSASIGCGDIGDFGPYMEYMQSQVKKRWKVLGTKCRARVVVKFQPFPDGSISAIAVEGNIPDEVRKAAVQSITESLPFGPFPPGAEQRKHVGDISVELTLLSLDWQEYLDRSSKQSRCACDWHTIKFPRSPAVNERGGHFAQLSEAECHRIRCRMKALIPKLDLCSSTSPIAKLQSMSKP